MGVWWVCLTANQFSIWTSCYFFFLFKSPSESRHSSASSSFLSLPCQSPFYHFNQSAFFIAFKEWEKETTSRKRRAFRTPLTHAWQIPFEHSSSFSIVQSSVYSEIREKELRWWAKSTTVLLGIVPKSCQKNFFLIPSGVLQFGQEWCVS